MDIAIDGLSKSFRSGRRTCRALDRIDLRISSGEMVALIGSSGSGKSTLMRHINGLCLGDAGRIAVGGRPIQDRGRLAGSVSEVRACIGMIFQQFNLVGRLSVLTNVLAGTIHHLPLWRSCLMRFTRAERLAALEALARVGMAEQALQRASTLSGGQQQRAAIARTLVQRAHVVLGDEPIASLDPDSARKVMDALARINREDGTTVVVSLHQVDYALSYCPRTIALRGGSVAYDGPSTQLSHERLAQIYGSDLPDLLAPRDSTATGTPRPTLALTPAAVA